MAKTVPTSVDAGNAKKPSPPVAKPAPTSSNDVASKSESKRPKAKTQTSMGSFALTTKDISEWKIDHPNNTTVMHLHSRSISIDFNKIKVQETTVKSMEAEARILANDGKFSDAQSLQEEANNMKSEYQHLKKEFHKAREVAKRAAFAKQFWMGEKEYAVAGLWDKLLNAARSVAMLDMNNNPMRSSIHLGSESMGENNEAADAVDRMANTTNPVCIDLASEDTRRRW